MDGLTQGSQEAGHESDPLINESIDRLVMVPHDVVNIRTKMRQLLVRGLLRFYKDGRSDQFFSSLPKINFFSVRSFTTFSPLVQHY